MSHKIVEFTLNQPLKYSKDGEKHEEQILHLIAPNFGSPLVKKNARLLKSLGFAAFMKAQKISGELPKPTPEELEEAKKAKDSEEKTNIFELFYVAGVETDPLCEAMAALAPAVVKIGGEHEFKRTHWDSLDMEEQERLTGVYLESFLMLSGSSTQKS